MQPTMLVLIELCFVMVKNSLFVGMFLGSHDVMDCVPVGTSVDDTSVGLARFEPYGLSGSRVLEFVLTTHHLHAWLRTLLPRWSIGFCTRW